jgi:hypothetical protein
MAPKPFQLSSLFGSPQQGMWRDPGTLAALASLGVHGLLFVVLPLLPDTAIQATEPEIKRPVEVVELTPEEQKRLPDMATQPPVELPPLTTLPKDNSPLFTIPSAKPPTSSFSSPDSLLAPPPPSSFFFPSLPPITQIPQIRTIPLAPAQPPARPASPQATAPQTPSSPTQSPSPSPSAGSPIASPPESTAESPQSPPESPLPSVAIDPAATPEGEPPASPRTEADINRDLLARNQELRELYTYNPSGTSTDDANISVLNWYSKAMGKDYAEGEQLERKETVSEYPKVACPLKQTRGAVVGVVVDGENQLVGDPAVVQSSGYNLFNRQAIEVAKTFNFENATGNSQAYLLKVTFEYSEEVCPPGLSPLNQAPAG